MSTDLKSRTKDVSLTRFFGGADRLTCVLVTMPRSVKLDPTDRLFTSLQLTRDQALTLARDLLDFAHEDEQEQVRDVDPCDDRVWEMDDDNALEEEF